MPALPSGRPSVLLGALVPAGFKRAAKHGEGWVAPFFGFDALVDGIAATRSAWIEAGRSERPRIVVERYFCLGAGADEVAEEYLVHYYGGQYAAPALADTLTTHERLDVEISRLSEAGCDDLLLFPCSGELKQVDLLAQALNEEV